MFLALVTTALAGWTQPDGAHYAKLGARGIVGEAVFPMQPVTPMGSVANPVTLGKYADWALQFYGEYGLTDDWTVIAQGTPIGFASLDDNSTLYTGVLKAGIRRSLLKGTHNVSVQADVGYTPPVGEVDLLASPILDANALVQPYVYIPTHSGVEAGGTLSYGAGFGQNWVVVSAGGAWYSSAAIDPAIVGSAQIGRQTKRANRWSLTLPVRQQLGSGMHVNGAGAGNTDYVGMIIDYTLTWGDGWGANTGFHSVLRASANRGAPTLPLYFEHQGGPT